MSFYFRSFIPFAIALQPLGETSGTDTPSTEETTTTRGDDDFLDFFTPEQLRHGGIVLYFLLTIYCFTLLAIVCDKYFLPSIERLCEVLNISAVSMKKIIINTIFTFISAGCCRCNVHVCRNIMSGVVHQYYSYLCYQFRTWYRNNSWIIYVQFPWCSINRIFSCY